ncbi:Bacterial transcription activator, effector binding domain [Shewanella putrefaciens]|uniref:GyrI-like domain-containing protein n=1 Tax=Shewanella putrefaciens TaxID=24 RepID=UPI000DFFFC12|nr:GyrI-like domain-containing protein [Shewanella putrefaciens]SUI60260.1 Bacterial transcription activator, effector binding domain [Shewanella putrefaciens]
MDVVYIDARPLLGLSTRTSNRAEMSADSAKIGGLWQAFFESSQLTAMLNSPMYGVYYDYESDMNGEFSVLVGKAIDSPTNASQFTPLTLEAGKYLKFSSQGEMPQCVIELWGQVWGYFSVPDCPNERRYQTDFEVYLSATEVEIYIGIL